MSKSQKKHSKEFKLETIELARTSGKSDSQLERELGLHLAVVQQERDILKKAVAIFTRSQR